MKLNKTKSFNDNDTNKGDLNSNEECGCENAGFEPKKESPK